MPLHLLGKKSWNIYNSASIERVRRDEAEAQAREEAAEQRMQEEDAQRRIALLRGESVPALKEEAEYHDDNSQRPKDETYSVRDRKRRRLRGEDDTDRDIRYAQVNTFPKNKSTQSLVRGKEKDAPLQDHAGNISLIPAPDETSIRKTEKNAEAEAEKAKKRKREEDQYTMRFSNASGFQTNMQQKPWYASKAAPSTSTEVMPEKDVWGNSDPHRKDREKSRISSNDPFAAMQQAQKQLKQSEMDKEAWQKKQKAELEEMKRQERREKERKRRHRRDDDVESLEGFSLDAPAVEDRSRDRSDHGRHRKHRHHHDQHRHRSRNRSRSRLKDRERHHSHSHRRRD